MKDFRKRWKIEVSFEAHTEEEMSSLIKNFYTEWLMGHFRNGNFFCTSGIDGHTSECPEITKEIYDKQLKELIENLKENV